MYDGRQLMYGNLIALAACVEGSVGREDSDHERIIATVSWCVSVTVSWCGQSNGLLEEEAEEEEEVGLQGGLGDFGFDVPRLRQEDEEGVRNADMC